MKKLWGIRHVRWFFLNAAYWHWWDRVGCRLGSYPSTKDMEYLEKVWKGEI